MLVLDQFLDKFPQQLGLRKFDEIEPLQKISDKIGYGC